MPQSLASVFVHLIFSTKNREPFLTPDVRAELFPYVTTILDGAGCSPLAANGVADHVHVLFILARTVRICDAVEEVKTNSSKWLKTKGTRFENFHWQAGYGAFSIGQSQVESVRDYIAGQEERHHTQSFQDEYRAFLKKYQVSYDERYVWD
jgi:REP element-mobilizing transposase RayT